MNLCFFSCLREYAWGAPDYAWVRAARKALADGHRVLAFVSTHALSHREIMDLRRLGARLAVAPDRTQFRGRLQAFRKGLQYRNRSFRKVISSFQPKLVFVNQGGSYDFLCESYLLDYISESGCAYVPVCHLNQEQPPFSSEMRERIGRFMSGARAVFVNSAYTRALIEKQLLMKLENAVLFHPPLPFPLPAEPLAWFESDTIRLASVSRLDMYQKGLDLVLEALARMGADYDWMLEIVGSGGDEEYLRSYATRLGIDDRIEWTGRVEDVREVWRRNHMLLMPSRFEGLGMAMLEAMACGRPVLRTPYGGDEEWMEDGVNGFVCPAAGSSLLEEALRNSFQCRSDWKRMGECGFRKLIAEFPQNPESVYFSAAGIGV